VAPTSISADTANWLVHPFSGAVGAIILSAAVRALPEPGTSGANPFSALYGWFFRFMNGILANFDRSNPASFPPAALLLPRLFDLCVTRRLCITKPESPRCQQMSDIRSTRTEIHEKDPLWWAILKLPFRYLWYLFKNMRQPDV